METTAENQGSGCCASCNKVIDQPLTCSRCKSTSYCSAACHKNDRKEHKRSCTKWQGDWVLLCKDPRWMYCSSSSCSDDKKEEGEEQQPLMFVKAWDVPDMRKALISEIIPAPIGMHRGALAPAWVFQVTKLFREEEASEDMDRYQRRLLSFLCGRFVIMSRPGATPGEQLEATNGIPKNQVRYWWRYWDNHGNVHEVKNKGFRRNIATMEPPDTTTIGLNQEHALPGDFRTEKTWLRDHMGYYNGKKFGPIVTFLSNVFENMWFWKFKGTTCCDSWDRDLVALEKSAGIPSINN